MALVFIYFFQTFQSFCGQICGSGLISVRFRYTKFLPSVVQPTAHLHGLVSCYRRWMNKFSKMKVHWWTYDHCLFVSYLTSVAFRYGWRSDTKFQKFSDKDWKWIFKKFIGYGSGVKNQYPLAFAVHQRWLESLFQTPIPLLLKNFWIRVRLLFKFENPTPVQTPATIIDPTVIYPCFYLRNHRKDPCFCRNGKVTPDPVFHKFLTPDPAPKEKRRIRRSLLRLSGSGPTSAVHLCLSRVELLNSHCFKTMPFLQYSIQGEM